MGGKQASLPKTGAGDSVEVLLSVNASQNAGRPRHVSDPRGISSDHVTESLKSRVVSDFFEDSTAQADGMTAFLAVRREDDARA